jgi:hypothetical protein
MAKCPVTRGEFRKDAQPLKVEVNGVPMIAEVKEFSTGSLGWYLNGKSVVDIGGKQVTVQIGMSITVIGSKDLPEDDETKEHDAYADTLIKNKTEN